MTRFISIQFFWKKSSNIDTFTSVAAKSRTGTSLSMKFITAFKIWNHLPWVSFKVIARWLAIEDCDRFLHPIASINTNTDPFILHKNIAFKQCFCLAVLAIPLSLLRNRKQSLIFHGTLENFPIRLNKFVSSIRRWAAVQCLLLTTTASDSEMFRKANEASVGSRR